MKPTYLIILSTLISFVTYTNSASAVKPFTLDTFKQVRKEAVENAIRSAPKPAGWTKPNKYNPGIDHHIIPQNQIKTYLSKVLLPCFDQAKKSKLRVKVLKAMNEYSNAVNNVKKGFFSGDQTNMVSDLISSIVWNFGNTVPGPSNRSDDPHNGFDAPLFKYLQRHNKPLHRLLGTAKGLVNQSNEKFLNKWRAIVRYNPQAEFVQKNGQWKVKN